MSREREDWGRFAAKAAVLAVVVMAAAFVGNRIASARDGVPGGPPRTAFTVAGTLTGVTGAVSAVFTFQNTGSSVTCTPPAVTITPDATTGAYSVEVDTESCSGALFNGGNVTVSVSLGDAGVVVRNANVNPVPYALYAQQYGTPDCPVGYERQPDPTFTGSTRLCIRRNSDGTVYDEVVRVGAGPSAFWVDRYEGGLYAADGRSNCDSARGLPVDGQPRALPSCLIRSASGVSPSSMNWFQANRACLAAGKRLPSGPEWLLAADGTDDPTTPSDGADARCVTDRGEGPRAAGGRNLCRSTWGAEDMIGNLHEWTNEWYATIGDFTSRQRWVQTDGGVDWAHDDTVHNVLGTVAGPGGSGRVSGIPAAALRGGYWSLGRQAGVFQLFLLVSPSDDASHGAGVRCVIPR